MSAPRNLSEQELVEHKRRSGPEVAPASDIGAEDLLPRIANEGYDSESLARRRTWLQSRTGVSLRHIGGAATPPDRLRGNIENPIGMAQVPVGVAGPVFVRGQHANGLFYVPMATTEGALIRSYERGMVTLSHAGGAEAAVLKDENQIAPVFQFGDIAAAAAFQSWAGQHLDQIRTQADATTAHGKVTNLEIYQVGRQVILDLAFQTGDAQGMNMIVKACDAACSWIRKNYSCDRFFLFSGMCSEKRASGYVMTRGKGKRVVSGALVPERILQAFLHVTSRALFDMWQAGALGHMQAGALGSTAQVANGLAAMFIAMGQDVATVAHSACAITSFELDSDGLYASITLPALSVATVGGGTGLPAQREALELIGCYGAGKAKKLAEIIAAAALGGEISMAAALASHEFVAAHERYGRNRPESNAR